MKDIDYKELLKKYRRHVEYSEGIDFVGAMGTYERKYGGVQFTEEEVAFMRSISPDFNDD